MQEEIPAPRKKAEQPVSWWHALAVTWRGRLLLVRRPDEGLLADLWCLPLVPTAAPERIDGPALDSGFSVPPRWAEAPLPEVRHVFTHRIWQMAPVLGRSSRKPEWSEAPAERQCLIAPGERPPGGLPRVTTKLLERVGFAAP